MITAVKSETIRLVIVDDHPIAVLGVRVGLKRFADIHIEGEALDGTTGLALILERQPDVALIDVWLPDMDGFDLAERLRETSPETRVIIISGDITPAMRSRISDLGISGFFQKSEPLERLAGLVRRHRPAQLSATTSDAPPATGPLSTLTLDEHEFLSLLATGDSLSRIARQMHLSRLELTGLKRSTMTKLAIDDHFELVRFARREESAVAPS
ncbi:MAG TPA: response regulator transcription factor [Planctomycetaceae bacterium]|nr:response regulator transcription factor [Planctomycetaceae bacterium]